VDWECRRAERRSQERRVGVWSQPSTFDFDKLSHRPGLIRLRFSYSIASFAKMTTLLRPIQPILMSGVNHQRRRLCQGARRFGLHCHLTWGKRLDSRNVSRVIQPGRKRAQEPKSVWRTEGIPLTVHYLKDQVGREWPGEFVTSGLMGELAKGDRVEVKWLKSVL